MIRRYEKIVLSLVGSIAFIILSFSVYTITIYFVPIHFWDQWEMVKALTLGTRALTTAGYIFTHHNEHIIATSRILFLIDFLFFDYANYFLIFSIIFLNICIAISIARIYIENNEMSPQNIVVYICFFTVTLSIVQWENLLIGFQTQFSLVAIFSILSIAFMSNFHRTKSSKQLVMKMISGAFLAAAALLSMGNGIALVFSIAFLLIVYWNKKNRFALVLMLVGALSLGVLTIGAKDFIGDPQLRTLPNVVAFFLMVLGAPLARSPLAALVVGSLLFCALAAWFWAAVARRWLRGDQLDIAQVRLVAIAAFLLGSAAAAALGRVGLGAGVALSSRYTTPTLILWLCLVAGAARLMADRGPSPKKVALAKWAASLAALAIGTVSSFHPSNIENMAARHARLLRASLFIISGVMSEKELGSLYPDPRAILTGLEDLRTRRLNIFSETKGPSLPARSLLAGRAPQSIPDCPAGNVDSVSRATETGWSVEGWVLAGSPPKTPEWVITIDKLGHPLGVMRPLEPRRDVVSATDVANARGFLAPLRLIAPPESGDAYFVVALTSHGAETCKLRVNAPMPFTRILANVSGLAVIQTMGAAPPAPPGDIPPVQIPNPQNVSMIAGTWRGSDSAIGHVVVHIDANTVGCSPVFVPVLRGPSASGLTLHISRNDQETEVTGLESLRHHIWNYLQLTQIELCPAGRPSTIAITLKDQGRGWGAWGALGAPMRQSRQ